MKQYIQRLSRIAALKMLSLAGRDIHIKHHWVDGKTLCLHSFRHKGYWWHGRRREAATMRAIEKIVKPGMTVFDVGAHIGYFTIYFSDLVGAQGKVVAFEPSEENLVYTRPNVSCLTNVKLETSGVSNCCGEAAFFIEKLTGQNNSLIKDYDVFEKNASRAGFENTKCEVRIPVTTLDAYCSAWKVVPNFIKMDIEGAEVEAIEGMRETLEAHRPTILLEVSRKHAECLRLFKKAKYRVFDDTLKDADESLFDCGETWPGPLNFFFVPE